jgi:CTP:molybdopterin cytidylyltransferase MocA
VTIALAILAAGASERLGEPKALARIGEKSAVEHLLAAGAALGDPRPLVIAGAHAAEIERACAARAEVAFNPRWSEGRTGGVALAHALRPGLDLCLAPVDAPLVPGAVFAALAQAWNAAGEPELGWLAPHFPPGAPPGGRRYGHPVVAGRRLLDRLGALAPGAPLRSLRALAEPLFSIGTDRAAVLDDLDTPEDLERLRRSFRD